MNDLPSRLQVFFQQNLNLLLLLLVLLVLGAVLLPRVLYRKHIASNGKVVVTQRFQLPEWMNRRRHALAYKPLSVSRRRRLALLFTLQMVALGLIVYAFGIVLLDISISGLVAGSRHIQEPNTLVGLVAGIACAIAGVLIIYWRNKANPFSGQ